MSARDAVARALAESARWDWGGMDREDRKEFYDQADAALTALATNWELLSEPLDTIRGLASRGAISARAGGHSGIERTFLDILAVLERLGIDVYKA
ncbi:hypothetical protein SEA_SETTECANDELA_199 [Mycobacterium phage Settecandela]|nr:hypothetical protein SEA_SETTECANDELA_199 [Mycobacterium phage Settecandela]